MNTRKCELCEKLFVKPKKISYEQWESRKYCSYHCSAKKNTELRMKKPGFNDLMRRMATGIKQSEETKIKRGIYKKGSEHYLWKGGISDDGNGYLRENKSGHRQRLHRKIMENYLGRKLTKDEHIHHLNGNKKDNRVDNLRILSSSEHSRIHATEMRLWEYAQKAREKIAEQWPV